MPITTNAPITKIQSNAGINVAQSGWSKGERPQVGISKPCHLENCVYRRYSSPQSPIAWYKSRDRLNTDSISSRSSGSSSKPNTWALSSR